MSSEMSPYYDNKIYNICILAVCNKALAQITSKRGFKLIVLLIKIMSDFFKFQSGRICNIRLKNDFLMKHPRNTDKVDRFTLFY